MTGKPLPGGGVTAPSPDRTDRTTVMWMDTELPTSGGEGYGSSVLPLSHLVNGDSAPFGTRKGVPSLVYLSREKLMEKSEAFEGKLFGDERVGISAHLFNCYRISLDDIPSAALRKEYKASKGPSIVLLDAEGKEVKRYVGWRTTGARLYRDLRAVAKAHYGLDLARALKKEAQLLKDLDKAYWDLEDLKYDLGELAKRKDSKSARRQETKLRDKMAKLETRIEELRKLERDHVRAWDTPADAPQN